MDDNLQKLIKPAPSRILANIYNHYLSEKFYQEMTRTGNFDGLDFIYSADNYENISVLKYSSKNPNLKFTLATFFDQSIFDEKLAERAIERVSIIFKTDKTSVSDLKSELKNLHHIPWRIRFSTFATLR